MKQLANLHAAENFTLINEQIQLYYMSDDYTYFNLSTEEVIAILRIIG